jgi:uncharacterized Zn-finger protein
MNSTEHATVLSPITVTKRHVSCAGEGGVLGHPKIYLEIGENNEAECPYCGQQFIYAEHHVTEE